MHFADPFLSRMATAVARRRRALSHQGELSLGSGEDWLAVSLEVACRRAVTLCLAPRLCGSLRVTSTWSRDRGKVLLAIDPMRLPGGPRSVIAAFERTVHDVCVTPDAFDGAVVATWRRLALIVC